MILLSACLYGLCCRHEGDHRDCPALRERLQGECLLIVCPEQLAGLPTPRPPADLRGGDGVDVLAGKARVRRVATGEDVTDAFRLGAERTLRMALACGVTRAILKSKSPSCGAGTVHIDGHVDSGLGVTAALLLQSGIAVEEHA